MDYTITTTDPRDDAGIAKKVAAYNAGQADADKLTAGQFLFEAVLKPTVKAWADEMAPCVIPSGTWLQRWTAAEKAWARASSDPQIKAWLTDLDSHENVDLTHAEVRQGVPYVCAAMEAAGVLALGQGAVRTAAILAF